MDITLVSHLGSAASTADAPRASASKGTQPAARPLVADAGRVVVEKAVATVAIEIAEAVQAIERSELPAVMKVRSQLGIDDASRRVVARTIDRETGETVRQYPAEDALRLIAKTRAQFSELYKTEV